MARDETDYAFAENPPYPDALQPTSQLARRYGAGSAAAKAGHQRYFVPSASAVQTLLFNSRSPELADPSVRRAINLALDRMRLAALTGSQPSQDLLPPGVPGAGGPTVYPLDAPNVKQALALMRGRHVELVLFSGTPDNCVRCAETADIVSHDLGAIGITVHVKEFDDRFGQAIKSKDWDLLAVTWFMDFADPTSIVNGLFDPQHPVGYGYSVPLSIGPGRPWRERMRAAHAVGGAARAGAYRRLVAGMFRADPPAAVYALQNGPPQLVSTHIGCQVFRPQDLGYVDLAALCLRGQG